MRSTLVAGLAALALGAALGCSVSEPMSGKLAFVTEVESMQASGKRMLAALKARDASIAAQAATADFRLADGGTGGPEALVVMVQDDVARYEQVDGGYFKVREIGDVVDVTTGEREVLCEYRFRGVRVDGQRAEEIRWMRARFRPVGADGSDWRMTWCNELRRHAVLSGATLLYEDWTARSGIRQTYQENLPEGEGFYPGEHHGGGLVAADADGDGDVDVLASEGGRVRCWRNRGDGTFEEVAEGTGLQPVAKGTVRGVLFSDLDGDGHRDLFLGVFGGPNVFYRGTGPFAFREATAASGFADSGTYSSSVVAADLDNDGDLEVYVCNFGGTRERAVDDFARNGEANRCYRNDGNGRFTEVAEAWGLADTGYSLAVNFVDVDGDGDQDCYIANDFAFNKYFRNRGDGTFEDVTDATGAGDVGMGMGITFADLDGDGDLDGYVSNMYSSVGHWIFDDEDYPVSGWLGTLFRDRFLQILKKMAQGNTILRNDGDRFTVIGEDSGAANAGWAWNAPAVDLDGDGRTDLYVAIGMITGPSEEDT
ncbi:MAG: FG-GAP repeat domain-containing protein [Planctomycetota bacterium]|jgi:hypothetical protein